MYEKILAATDLTRASSDALRHATALGRLLGAHVYVLHVVDPPVARHTSSLRAEQAVAAAARTEVEAVHRLLDDQTQSGEVAKWGVRMTTLVRTGTPAETIVHTARDLGADLIVMGTHAREGLQHAMLGSVAERVIRHAPCPVVCARTGPSTS